VESGDHQNVPINTKIIFLSKYKIVEGPEQRGDAQEILKVAV
jgi:hypothetical protein